jgi:hypothetical protein
LKVSKRCYLCGLDGADTHEHVVSKCFYVEPLPSDMITVPAHDACNKSTSKDEEWMSVVWATCRPLGWGSQERWDKAMRTLKRTQSARFKEAYMRSHTPLPDGGAKVYIEEPRVYYVVAKIVKGLIHHATGALLCDHVWTVRSINMATMGALDWTNTFVVHDVACLRWAAAADPPYSLVGWALSLYNFHFYSGYASVPEMVPDIGTGGPPVPLPWPKPQAPKK